MTEENATSCVPQHRWVSAPSWKGQDEGCVGGISPHPSALLDGEGANITHDVAVGSVCLDYALLSSDCTVLIVLQNYWLLLHGTSAPH